jgi:16S rRNA (guanine966-N2)-methyltransferase
VALRIVAGEHRGRRIGVPAGSSIRPTADRVREALFSILGDVGGLRVLDLFAGSGALGIEALSRGAATAVFVDEDRAAAEAVRQNLAALGLEGAVTRRDALGFLAASSGQYDLVFCDPPYDSAVQLAGSLAERLPARLAPQARIVTESDKRTPLELPFPVIRERDYGDTRIVVYRGE